MTRLVALWLVAGLGPATLFAQTYLWPTNASKWMTSSFAESRPRRFHAGIDIKTWNRTGYEVYATRSGSIWRVRVSPFGYGRALYLKADTGEIFVYAHLERFAPKIQEIVEAEQERTGRYTIDRTFSAGALPVTRGEVIAYTGESGVGVPHLHFEIRDSHNRPLNPLLRDFEIPDHDLPVIRAVGLVPIDPDARINGDIRPLILPAKLVRSGEYRIEELVELYGQVGFGVSAWDKPGPIPNRTGVYELRLLVDGVVQFQTRYDAFDFAYDRLVELDRNYLLSRRGYGSFYNLFRHPANRLRFYSAETPWAGVVSGEMLVEEVTSGDQMAATASEESTSGGSPIVPPERLTLPGAGTHRFTIEVADFRGNRSRVTGSFIYGRRFGLQADIVRVGQEIRLRGIRAQGDVELARLEAWLSPNGGKTWRQLPLPKDALAQAQNHSDEGALLVTLPTVTPASVVKLEAVDPKGVHSYPVFAPIGAPNLREVQLEWDFYPRAVRVQVSTDGLPEATPKLVVRNETGDRRDIGVWAESADRFCGIVPLDATLQGTNRVEVYLPGDSGDSLWTSRTFFARRVMPGSRTTVFSPDGACWVEFSPRSAYAPFFSRIDFDPVVDADSSFVLGGYAVFPYDEPLDRGARVFIRYPDHESPDKLGIYYENKPGKWAFVDNQVDSVRRTIWARVFSLERFALIRDDRPPAIARIYPSDGSRLRHRQPLLSVEVKDEGSGLAGEEKVFITLDGRRVPAEYDPESDTLRYRPRYELPSGSHTMVVHAEDRNGNVAEVEVTFWIE